MTWWQRFKSRRRGRLGLRSSWLLTTLIDPSMPTVSFLEQFDAARNAESGDRSDDRNQDAKPADETFRGGRHR